ncbi:DUF983 domain-containing protein [Xanthobacter sp. V4C-4]|uniref:DUF983 domain-containing protein n=1 Tax=Xanthobacter cornucopiae TaxID=3119924 RepID=UPI0037269773
MTSSARTPGAPAAATLARPFTERPLAEAAPRAVPAALRRGARGRCPACGAGRLFSRYLKVESFCGRCGEELYHHRADDAPPYAVILVVGHVVVPAMVLVEELFRPPLWSHLALWLPLTLVLSLVLLPPAKGLLIALQWALRMHGFDPASPEREPPPAGAVRPSFPPSATPLAS